MVVVDVELVVVMVNVELIAVLLVDMKLVVVVVDVELVVVVVDVGLVAVPLVDVKLVFVVVDVVLVLVVVDVELVFVALFDVVLMRVVRRRRARVGRRRARGCRVGRRGSCVRYCNSSRKVELICTGAARARDARNGGTRRSWILGRTQLDLVIPSVAYHIVIIVIDGRCCWERKLRTACSLCSACDCRTK